MQAQVSAHSMHPIDLNSHVQRRETGKGNVLSIPSTTYSRYVALKRNPIAEQYPDFSFTINDEFANLATVFAVAKREILPLGKSRPR